MLNLEQNSLFDVQGKWGVQVGGEKSPYFRDVTFLGLSCLPMLEWLNLSGNSLKVELSFHIFIYIFIYFQDFSGVKANVRLSHLDLSDNRFTKNKSQNSILLLIINITLLQHIGSF